MTSKLIQMVFQAMSHAITLSKLLRILIVERACVCVVFGSAN